jgi:hypothetical protein
MLIVTRRLVGKSWSGPTIRENSMALLTLVALMINSEFNPDSLSRWVIGLLVLAMTAWVTLKRLAQRSNITMASLYALVTRGKGDR